MLTEDYILRMINQALSFLLIALGLKKAGQYKEATQAFDQAIESLLGLNARLARQIDDGILLKMLTFQDKLDVNRVITLADVLREESDVYTLQGQSESSQFAAMRSLRLYLETFLTGETRIELIQKIEELHHTLIFTELPFETRLALLDYLDRLLASGDDFLTNAGLSRPDLLSDLSSLNSSDLQ